MQILDYLFLANTPGATMLGMVPPGLNHEYEIRHYLYDDQNKNPVGNELPTPYFNQSFIVIQSGQ